MEPSFYDDMEAAGKVMQKIKGLRDKLSRYDALKSLWEDLCTLVELALEENDESVLDEVKGGYKTLCENLENMKLETMLSGKYDKNNAIITLHAGAGGTEAQDWCEMLYRMYTHWAERKGFKVETLHADNAQFVLSGFCCKGGFVCGTDKCILPQALCQTSLVSADLVLDGTDGCVNGSKHIGCAFLCSENSTCTTNRKLYIITVLLHRKYN